MVSPLICVSDSFTVDYFWTSACALDTHAYSLTDYTYVDELTLHFGEEWKRYKQGACIWHMLTDKRGDAKLKSMKRDGVYIDMD